MNRSGTILPNKQDPVHTKKGEKPEMINNLLDKCSDHIYAEFSNGQATFENRTAGHNHTVTAKDLEQEYCHPELFENPDLWKHPVIQRQLEYILRCFGKQLLRVRKWGVKARLHPDFPREWEDMDTDSVGGFWEAAAAAGFRVHSRFQLGRRTFKLKSDRYQSFKPESLNPEKCKIKAVEVT